MLETEEGTGYVGHMPVGPKLLWLRAEKVCVCSELWYVRGMLLIVLCFSVNGNQLCEAILMSMQNIADH